LEYHPALSCIGCWLRPALVDLMGSAERERMSGEYTRLSGTMEKL
jgi:hypothetical protein